MQEHTHHEKKGGDSELTYELLPDAASFFQDLHAEVQKTPDSIDMQFYSFEADGVGEPLGQALIGAQAKGTDVRVMVDEYILLSHNAEWIQLPRPTNKKLYDELHADLYRTKTLLKEMEASGIGVQLTNPLGILWHKGLQRDHKKLVVINGNNPEAAIAYMGSLQPCDHNAAWHDFMVKMKGSMVPALQEDFNKTWRHENNGGVEAYDGGRVLADAPGCSVVIPYISGLISRAEERVMIESPYLWGKGITRVLKEAVARDVEVSVIIPERNNKKLFAPSHRSMGGMAKSGISVYEWGKGKRMMHARGALVDKVGVFGSNTFNEFLAGKTAEINIATDNGDLVSQLEEFFRKDMAGSKLL